MNSLPATVKVFMKSTKEQTMHTQLRDNVEEKEPIYIELAENVNIESVYMTLTENVSKSEPGPTKITENKSEFDAVYETSQTLKKTKKSLRKLRNFFGKLSCKQLSQKTSKKKYNYEINDQYLSTL